MFTSKGIILMCGYKENNTLKPHENGRKEKALRQPEQNMQQEEELSERRHIRYEKKPTRRHSPDAKWLQHKYR